MSRDILRSGPEGYFLQKVARPPLKLHSRLPLRGIMVNDDHLIY
jgi:hypothetical protein